MGFGQYSAGGGLDRKKDDMLAVAGDTVWSRKAGKNRVHFKRADGSQGFILHQTIVAELSPEGDRLTLADGGWHTPTTKSAWCDACAVFGFKTFDAFDWGRETHNGVKGRWRTSAPVLPSRDERSVTYKVTRDGDAVSFERTDVAASDPYLIRADVDYENFAVRWDGRMIRSDAGLEMKASPFHVLRMLYRIDALAKATKSYITMRGSALDQFGFDVFGYRISPGQTSRVMMVGCHTFKTHDFRALLRRIAADFPREAKLAKSFVRKHPTDFGIAAYEAERRERAIARREAYRPAGLVIF